MLTIFPVGLDFERDFILPTGFDLMHLSKEKAFFPTLCSNTF